MHQIFAPKFVNSVKEAINYLLQNTEENVTREKVVSHMGLPVQASKCLSSMVELGYLPEFTMRKRAGFRLVAQENNGGEKGTVPRSLSSSPDYVEKIQAAVEELHNTKKKFNQKDILEHLGLSKNELPNIRFLLKLER